MANSWGALGKPCGLVILDNSVGISDFQGASKSLLHELVVTTPNHSFPFNSPLWQGPEMQ